MYTVAFVDRTNIALALPVISSDLHMRPAQAGEVAGIFFWGYMLLQIPGGYLASRWSAKWLVAILLVAWGLAATACGFARTWQELWVLRLILGIAEGGVWPATLVLLARWFGKAERARANAFWMLCLPVAVIATSPISGWILSRWNWRVLLAVEGLLPFVWLPIWLMYIDDGPAQARWVPAALRNRLAENLERENLRVHAESVWRTLARRQVLLMIAINVLFSAGIYGYVFWLPSAMARAASLSSVQTGLLNAVPYLIAAVGMVLVSQHSDRSGERRKHVSACLAWSGIFLLAGIFSSEWSPAFAFALISMVGVGFYAALGPFWAIPSETLPNAAAGLAMGMINSVGNLGGYAGPKIMGFLAQRTGNFRYAFGSLAIGLLVAAALTLALTPVMAESRKEG